MLNLKQLLKFTLKRLERPEPDAKILTVPEIEKWPEEIFDTFLSHSIIKPAEFARVIECDQCEERCFEEVGYRVVNGVLRAFIPCGNRDDIGRIEINLKRLKQWRTGLDLLVGFLVSGLGIKNRPKIIRNGFYKLGETELNGKNVDVFLASSHDQIFKQSADERNKYIALPAVIFTPLNKPSDFDAHGINALPVFSYINAKDKSISLDLERVQEDLRAKEAKPDRLADEKYY